MVAIQSKEVIDKISEDLKVQPSLLIPRELAKTIQLVYNVNPGVNDRLIQIKSADASDALSATIHTTSATKDTFIIGGILSIAKDVNSDALFSRILVTPFGDADQPFMMIRYEPLTAGAHHDSANLAIPIKLARGTAITLSNSTATGSIDTRGIVFYYETDPQ